MDETTPVQDRLRNKGHVWGFDAMWQTPARTEEHAFRRCWETLPKTPGATYVGFPWATLIDHLQTKSGKGTFLKSALRRFAHVLSEARPTGRVVTVCQHIMSLDFIALYRQLGVTDIFWSHAEYFIREVDGINIHPFPLYPAVTADILRQEPGLAFQDRKYLYSFTGAYDPSCYRTAAREWMSRLGDSLGDHAGFVKVRTEWHFQKTVYDVQVRGIPLAEVDRTAMLTRERDYLELLRQTVFSLCPSGSGPNSIRLWESLALGAVPVILADGLELPGDVMLWQQAAVFVRETPEAVAGIPELLARLASRPELLEAKRHFGAVLYERYGPGNFIYDLREFMVYAPALLTAPCKAAVMVLDPGLKDTQSHHHVVNKHLHRYGELKGLSLRVYGNAKAKPENFPYEMVPQFRFSVYDDSAALPFAAYQEQVLAHYTDLQALVEGAQGDSSLVVHTTTAAFLQGLALSLMRAPFPFRAVVVELMFHPLSFLKRNEAAQQPFARYLTALRLLKRYQAERGVPVHLSTSCSDFSHCFESLVGEEVPIHPYALLGDGPHKAAPAPPAASGARKRVLLFAGDLKLDKGVSWVVDALDTLLLKHAELTFVMHLGDNRFENAQLREIQKTAVAIAKKHRNLELLQGYLPDSAWDAVMCELDVCVIPYDPRAYANKSSGVFWDAIQKLRSRAGLVVTRGTWMEREASSSGVSVAICQFGDTKGLSAALRTLTTGESVQNPLEEESRRAALRKYFGRGNDEFIFSLLASVPQE